MPKADVKVFDSASLLTIYDNSVSIASSIGSFQSVSRQDGLPPDQKTQHHSISAWTRAYWCEKLKICIVEQNVHVSNFGINWLPSGHPYRSAELPRLRMIRTALNSADLLRGILRFADEWENDMAQHLPESEFCAGDGVVHQVMDAVTDEINAGALGPNVSAKVKKGK